jgi:hypothetical protein
MTLKLVLDRYEEDFGVCLDFDDKRHLIPKEILKDMKVNDIFTIEFDGTSYHSPNFLAEETANARERISQKMLKIYKMTRHRRPPKI